MAGMSQINAANPQRLHYLDSLRASMMLLGIVLHAAMNYGTTVMEYNVIQDPANSMAFDLVFYLIHIFRMPLFFVLAGFFMALLIERRGLRRALSNRLQRIVLPFAVFWPILSVLLILVVVAGFGLIDSLSLQDLEQQSEGQDAWSTLHLWFLQFLMIFYGLLTLAYWLCQRLPQAFKNRLLDIFETSIKQGWGVLLLVVPVAWLGRGTETGMVEVTTALIPAWVAIAYYGFFFAIGLFIYRRQSLLTFFNDRWVVLIGLALFSFIANLAVLELRYKPDAVVSSSLQLLQAGVSNLTTWLFIFGLTGLFGRFMNRRSPTMRYLTDGSYWMYLIHLVFTIGFGIFLYPLAWPVMAKFMVNITLTALICIVSYHYLVRSTFIGEFLNGRRYAR